MKKHLMVRVLSAALALGVSLGMPAYARADAASAEGDAAQDVTLEAMAEASVVSMELKAGPDFPTQLVQGVNSSIESYDEYDGDELVNTAEYEKYYIDDDQKVGCTCTVTFSDGSTKVFTFKCVLGPGEDGLAVLHEWYEQDEFAPELYWLDEQDPENAWQVGNQYGLRVGYDTYDEETGETEEHYSNYLPIDIVPNPIESIEYEPARTVLIQGRDSFAADEYDEEGNPTGGTFDCYTFGYNEGSRLIVNYREEAGGRKTYVLRWAQEERDGELVEVGRYVNEQDPSDYIEESTVYISDGQNENHWGPGLHTYTVDYSGFSYQGTVEVKENWVASFAYNPVEPLVFVRGVDSTYGPYPFTESVQKQGDIFDGPSFKQGDQLVVQTTAGGEVTFTFNAQTSCFETDDTAYESIPASDLTFIGNGYFDSDFSGKGRFHWEVGTQELELMFMNSSAPVTVTVERGAARKANPIKATAAAREVLASSAKANAQVLSLISVSGAQGEVSYHKMSGSDKLSIDETTGRVTLAKGAGVGTYSMVVHAFAEGTASYESGPSQVTVTVKVVDKFANPMVVKAAKKTAKYSKVKKKAVTVARPLTMSKAQGKLAFKKVSGSKKITVNAKTGKVTIKKGTKKGTYTIKIKVTAKGNGSYKSASKTVKTKIVVK